MRHIDQADTIAQDLLAKWEKSPRERIGGKIESNLNTCDYCSNLRYIKIADLPLNHPLFGKMHPCPRCNNKKSSPSSSIFDENDLKDLSLMNFGNFSTHGDTPEESKNLKEALDKSRQFAKDIDGWLIIAGDPGCGKTHLAASIANEVNIDTRFITSPDLMDLLRSAFRDNSYLEKFESIRTIPLLILDDFGVENETPWVNEKMFQLFNRRYVKKLPMVITTNISPKNIDQRISSRMQDFRLSKRIVLHAGDYRVKHDRQRSFRNL